MRRSTVQVLTSSEVVAVHGKGHVEAVDVHHHPTSTRRRSGATGIIAELGFLVDLGPLESWGLAIQARRIVVGTTMATDLPRVYAAGDIVAYTGKVRLIATGFGEVATAVNNAAVLIDPAKPLLPGHSTESRG